MGKPAEYKYHPSTFENEFRYVSYYKGMFVYKYLFFRLYEKKDGWQIADDDGWYKGVYPTALAAVKATDFEENW